MKIDVFYPHIISSSDPESRGPMFFEPYEKRFVESYLKFKAGIKHRLKIILCGEGDTEKARATYQDIPSHGFARYKGNGWDIGAFQDVAVRSGRDLIVCCITPTHFREDNWLALIAEAFEKYGDGLYGTSGSYQGIPHIRTGCFAFSPATMRRYPWHVNSRQDGFLFESGVAPGRVDAERSFTNWLMSQNRPVKMVTRGGCYDLNEWRKPDNVFRRGDQSNALAWDRHFDIYAAADPAEKIALEKLADG